MRSEHSQPQPAAPAPHRPALLHSLLIYLVAWVLALGRALGLVRPEARTDLIPTRCRLPSSAALSALAWHPYQSRFAAALRDGSVHLFDVQAQSWLAVHLTHEFQSEAFALAWQPNAGHTLAVGVAHGIALWHIAAPSDVLHPAWTDPASAAAAGERSLAPDVRTGPVMTFLSDGGRGPVTSLAWSPLSALLAAGAAGSSAVTIWDTALSHPTPLDRSGGAVTLLAWSPDGAFLFVAHDSATCRVWEARTWTCETWSLDAPVAAAVWAPSSRDLLLSLVGASALLCLRINREPPAIRGQIAQRIALAVPDASPDALLRRGPASDGIHGPIVGMALDATGERLVVWFASTRCQLLCHVRFGAAATTITPRGFLGNTVDAGLGAQPALCCFRPAFSRGALLATLWNSEPEQLDGDDARENGGVVALTPMYFIPAAAHDRSRI